MPTIRMSQLAEQATVVNDTLHVPLFDPLSGEIYDDAPVDRLVELYLYAKNMRQQFSDFEDSLRRKMGSMAEGNAKTRRLAGETRLVKIEMPSDRWSNSILKPLWLDERFDLFRDDYLRIDTIAPQLTEVKKLMSTTCQGLLATFRDEIARARLPATAAPVITVEK